MFGKKLFRQQKSTRIKQVTTAVAPHGVVLNPILATTINQMPVNAEWLSKLSVAAPLGMLANPTGTHIYLQRQTPFLAKLSGGSSPYSWQEVYSSAPGTISVLSGGRSGTSNAYELNSKASLNNAIVEITPMGGWYAFQHVGYSPSCTGRGNNLCLTIIGCSSQGVPGANVDFVLGGSTVHSGVTNSSGQACLFEPAPGSYTINWSIPGTIFSGTRSATITNACLNSGLTEFLNPPGTYACRCCPIPVPPLFITDEAGTRPLGQCFSYNGYTIMTSLGFLCTNPASFWVDVAFRPGGSCPLPNCCAPGGPYCIQTDPVELTSCNPFYFEGTYPATSGNCILFTPPSMALPLSGGYAVHT